MWCIAAATGIMDCSNRMGSEYDERLKAAIIYEFYCRHAARRVSLRQACGLAACYSRRERRAGPHLLLQATVSGRPAAKVGKNAFLGDPTGGEPVESTSKRVWMLAYARLVPHSYHVLHGIAAY